MAKFSQFVAPVRFIDGKFVALANPDSSDRMASVPMRLVPQMVQDGYDVTKGGTPRTHKHPENLGQLTGRQILDQLITDLRKEEVKMPPVPAPGEFTDDDGATVEPPMIKYTSYQMADMLEAVYGKRNPDVLFSGQGRYVASVCAVTALLVWNSPTDDVGGTLAGVVKLFDFANPTVSNAVTWEQLALEIVGDNSEAGKHDYSLSAKMRHYRMHQIANPRWLPPRVALAANLTNTTGKNAGKVVTRQKQTAERLYRLDRQQPSLKVLDRLTDARFDKEAQWADDSPVTLAQIGSEDLLWLIGDEKRKESTVIPGPVESVVRQLADMLKVDRIEQGMSEAEAEAEAEAYRKMRRMHDSPKWTESEVKAYLEFVHVGTVQGTETEKVGGRQMLEKSAVDAVIKRLKSNECFDAPSAIGPVLEAIVGGRLSDLEKIADAIIAAPVGA